MRDFEFAVDCSIYKKEKGEIKVRQLSNQNGAISGTVCGWHVWILPRIPVARILWDFDFLPGLAPGRLDGFSIGRYEKNRESFDLYAVKLKSGAMRFFWGKIAPLLEPFQNFDSSLLLLIYW